MSDYMEMSENYKKIWEQSLASKTSEIELLQKQVSAITSMWTEACAENVRLTEALKHIGAQGSNVPDCCHKLWDNERDLEDHYSEIAREALKGEE
jgi:predicted nuclease with TOPRIM domain